MISAQDVDVLVIAVSHFGSGDVPALLASLQEGGGQWRLVVADNSDDLAEQEALRAALAAEPRAELVGGWGNAGYYGGARRALDLVGGPAPWTVVANTDLRFAAHFVERLTGLGEDALVAPAIRSEVTGRDQNPFLEQRPSRFTVRRWRVQFATLPVARLVVAAGHLLAVGTRGRRGWRRERATPEQHPVYAPHGACVAFPASYFDRGGSLEHGAFMFGEEITVAERARALGIPVLYVPDLVVHHAEHRATGWWRSRQVLGWQRESVAEIARLLRR